MKIKKNKKPPILQLLSVLNQSCSSLPTLSQKKKQNLRKHVQNRSQYNSGMCYGPFCLPELQIFHNIIHCFNATVEFE